MTAKMQPFWYFKAPEITCPSGEQVANGTFETGDLTGWTNAYASVVDWYAHTGTYSCYLVTEAYIQQNIDILVSCIASFTLWVFNEFPAQNIQAEVTVHYSDDTEDVHTFILAAAAWTQLDMLPYLTTGKTVAYIKIKNTWAPGIYLDDVSLIGTG